MPAQYDFIGTTYDETRRAASCIVDRLIKLLNASPGARVLDVACGTANYTCALTGRGLVMVGVDRSWGMLAQGRDKKAACPLVLADALALPFADNSFAHAVTTIAIHQMDDLKRVFANVQRVLAKKGRYVIFSALSEQTEAWWLNSYFPAMMASAKQVLPSQKKNGRRLVLCGLLSSQLR